VEDSGVDGRIILRLIFRWCVVGAWTGLIWLRIGTTFGFHKMRGISWLVENRLFSQEGLYSVE
jgi:hypothetical protein